MSTLLLASKSVTRGKILRAAGLEFEQITSGVDEAPLKELSISNGVSPKQMAQTLAFAKAEVVCVKDREALVIGADQVLVLDGHCFDKPGTMAEAKDQLKALRGKTHQLETALCVVRAGKPLWHFSARPAMTMRSFSDRFLDDYMTLIAQAALWSPGSYQIEGPGAQLFEKMEGDYFSILGMPLLPLMNFLRTQGVVAT